MSFGLMAALGLLFGLGFGYCVQRAGLCFAHGLGEIFMGKGKRIFRLFIVIFSITGMGFLLSGYISPECGFKPIGQLRGFGFYNLLSGVLFGAGIALNGGCILGTLRQIGEGNMTFLIVMISFIPGMAIVVYGIDPLLNSKYNIEKLLLPDILGVSGLYVMTVLVLGTLAWFAFLKRQPR